MQAGEIPSELHKPGTTVPKMAVGRVAIADADGEFRIRVPRGSYELGGPLGLKLLPVIVADEREIVRDIDMPRLLRGQVGETMEFNVTDADNKPMTGAIVVRTPRSPAFEWPGEMKPLATGRFWLPNALIPAVLQARSADGRFAGIARVETDEDPRTIRLLPAAIARGRLLDDKGQAVAGGRLRCGIRVYEYKATKGRFSIASLGSIVTTGSDGSFELRALVPSEEYTLEFEPEPESNRWSPVSVTTA